MKIRVKLALFALFFTYCLAAFAILSPLLTALTNNPLFLSVGFPFVFFFVIFAWFVSILLPTRWNGIFSSLDCREIPKWWLRLHMLFTYTSGVLFMGIAVLIAMVPLYLQGYGTTFPSVFMMTGVSLFFSLLGLWCTHLVVGMGYKWFCKGRSLGIASLSALAYQALEKKRITGTEYLLDALLMFREYLRSHQLKNEELEKAIGTIRCFHVLKSEIPYETLQALALVLERFPSVESLPEALITFNESSAIKSLTTFKSIQKAGRAPIEWIVAIASIITALSFVPESTRALVLGYLGSIWSVDSIQVLVGFFFFGVAAIIASMDGDYRINPIREYLDARDENKKTCVQLQTH